VHNQAGHREADDPHDEQALVPTAPKAAVKKKNPKQTDRKHWPPLLFVRVKPEEDESQVLRNNGPASPARMVAGLAVRPPYGIEESPLEESRRAPEQSVGNQYGQKRIEQVAEEVFPGPPDYADARGWRFDLFNCMH
jgi:hypothetical protein